MDGLIETRPRLPCSLPVVRPLTENQRDLVLAKAHGLTHRAIARQRSRSIQTVKNTMTVIFDKLNAHSDAEAVYKCFGCDRDCDKRRTE